jgi:hypothetical protein
VVLQKAKKKDTHPALEKRQAQADEESLRNACKVLNAKIAKSQDELAKLASGPARNRKGQQAKKLEESIKKDTVCHSESQRVGPTIDVHAICV